MRPWELIGESAKHGLTSVKHHIADIIPTKQTLAQPTDDACTLADFSRLLRGDTSNISQRYLPYDIDRPESTLRVENAVLLQLVLSKQGRKCKRQ